jgi:hypothetical protein
MTYLTSGSNGLYFLTLPLVRAMRIIYTKKKNAEKIEVHVIQ